MTPVANANLAALFASIVRADTGFLDFLIPPAEKNVRKTIKLGMKLNFSKEKIVTCNHQFIKDNHSKTSPKGF